MLYAISGWFRVNSEAQRQAIHEEFNEHLSQRHPRLRLGGVLRDESGGRAGVLILLEADDKKQAQKFVDSSPYTRAGLYERIDLTALDIEVGSLG